MPAVSAVSARKANFAGSRASFAAPANASSTTASAATAMSRADADAWRARCEAAHVQASQMLRRFGLANPHPN